MLLWPRLFVALAATSCVLLACGEDKPAAPSGGYGTTDDTGNDETDDDPRVTDGDGTKTPPTGTTPTSDAGGQDAAPPAAGSPRFLAITPVRLLDSRDGSGSAPGKFSGKLEANTERVLALGGDGTFGPLATRTGFALQVTAVDNEGAGYLTAYPCGTAPEVASVNFKAGEAIGTGVTVVGTDKICLKSNVRTHVIVDGVGAFQRTAGARFTANDPRRVFDSRAGAKATLHTITIPGLPAQTEGVLAHLTITASDAPGFAVAYDCGAAPAVSSVNFTTGETIGSTTFARLGAGGKLCVSSSVAAHVIVDIEGSFGAGGTLGFMGRSPARIFDSRSGAAATSYEITVPAPPAGTTTAALSLSATDATTGTFAAVHACGNADVQTSAVNLVAGSVRTSLTFAPVSAAGKICVTTNAPVHIVADLLGVIAP